MPKKEMEEHIHAFLLSQLPEEPEMTSALMIYTLNKDREKAKVLDYTKYSLPSLLSHNFSRYLFLIIEIYNTYAFYCNCHFRLEWIFCVNTWII